MIVVQKMIMKKKKIIIILLKRGRGGEGSAGESIYELPAAMSASYEW